MLFFANAKIICGNVIGGQTFKEPIFTVTKVFYDYALIAENPSKIIDLAENDGSKLIFD